MKHLAWLGSSRDDVSSFPADARREIGYELYQVQQGLEPSDWKALSTLGPGVYEIRVHTENEYRAVYVTTFAEAIYVLHAFVKKTRRMSERDAAIIRKRYHELIQARSRT